MLQQRDYQTRIIDRTIAAVDQGHRSILIEAACSAGKTVIAHVIAQRLYERYGWTAGQTAYIVTVFPVDGVFDLIACNLPATLQCIRWQRRARFILKLHPNTPGIRGHIVDDKSPTAERYRLGGQRSGVFVLNRVQVECESFGLAAFGKEHQ